MLTVTFDEYKRRRQACFDSIGDGLFIIPGGKEKVKSRDNHYPFYQDRDFYYLTGFNEPDAILVLDGCSRKSYLFSRPYDEHLALWEGESIGQERAKKEYGFDNALPIDLFSKELDKLLLSADVIYYPFAKDSSFDQLLLGHIASLQNTRRSLSPQHLIHSDTILEVARLVKSEEEIAMMRFASKESIRIHKKAMAYTRAGMNEREISALFDYEFALAGGEAAYSSIVAGGNNACVLHYTDNNKPLKDNELILIDAGMAYEGYAADITRTFPISGRFTEAQKKVYAWVLKAMEAAINACYPGQSIYSPHEAAETVLIQAVVDLGLVKETVEEVKEKGLHRRYFMHGTSHWLGLDVHDVGKYKDRLGVATKLASGMVLTVEPGLYIREDDDSVPTEFRGIGIRIEDNILITDQGYENLTLGCPKTIEEVENACLVVN